MAGTFTVLTTKIKKSSRYKYVPYVGFILNASTDFVEIGTDIMDVSTVQ